ncbi:MAG: hypothetical protein H3C63_17050, partial [Candidatus Omnitrophica bacterium]|nr:hypothetical protein [Candidatus Omnitrophota bacterium]
KLDLTKIQNEFLILDEPEHSSHTGQWTTKSYNPAEHAGIPFGQYGRSYAISDDPHASWIFSFPIQKKAEYRIAFWAPLVPLPSAFIITLRTKNKTVLHQDFTLQSCNGWTFMTSIILPPGNYTLGINPIPGNPCYVDAVKIEKSGESA